MPWDGQHNTLRNYKKAKLFGFGRAAIPCRQKLSRGNSVPSRLLTRRPLLCKVNGNQYLHLIKAISGKRFQIGNNRGRINGWVYANSIYGRLDKVEA